MFFRHPAMQRLLLCMGVLLLGSCGQRGYVPANEVTPKFGKQLVAEYELPQAMLDRFNQFKPSRPVQGESVLANSVMADTKDWTSSALDVKASDGPYAVVVTLYATAKGPGGASSLWQAGWELDNGQGQRGVIPGLSRADAKAGEKLIMTVAGGPLRFKSDQKARVALSLVNTRNMEINAIRVAVVSGLPSSTWGDWFWVWRTALVGLIMFILWWFWFRPRSSGMT